MVKLDNKQNTTLRKFFYIGVKKYLSDFDMWKMQLDALLARGDIAPKDAEGGRMSFDRYDIYRGAYLDAVHDTLDVLWKDDHERGGWKRPEDAKIQDLIGKAVARLLERSTFKLGQGKDGKATMFHFAVPVFVSEILDHDGGAELKEGDDYRGFLDAKKTAYAPYVSDNLEECSQALADTMIGFLRQADDGDTEFARCVRDWALAAFAMWHAGQYEYSRGKQVAARFTGQQRDAMIDMVSDAAVEIFTNNWYFFPVGLLSGPGTVSAALDRFMAAYSTGEFPLDLTHDRVQEHKFAARWLPEEMRDCLEKGARSSREWQRAFAAVGDRWMAEHTG